MESNFNYSVEFLTDYLSNLQRNNNISFTEYNNLSDTDPIPNFYLKTNYVSVVYCDPDGKYYLKCMSNISDDIAKKIVIGDLGAYRYDKAMSILMLPQVENLKYPLEVCERRYFNCETRLTFYGDLFGGFRLDLYFPIDGTYQNTLAALYIGNPYAEIKSVELKTKPKTHRDYAMLILELYPQMNTQS